jgi:hypothetical protein
MRMRLFSVLGLLAISLSVSAQASPVVGTIRIVGPQPATDPTTLTLSATVRNTSHAPWQAPVVALGIAQLSVDVRDASGQRIGTVPPPVPRPGDDRLEPLAPGSSRTFALSLNVFSPPLPPGTYTADWGERAGIDTAPVTFVVTR